MHNREPALGGPLRAVTYERISQDREGQALGRERQQTDNREMIDRNGWLLVDDYWDDDTGASTKSTKKRPRYDAMLQAVRDGRVDVIVAYSNSRLTRRPAEWLELVRIANEHQVRIVTKMSGNHDLTTADGRAVALTIAAWDAAEAERTGERVARAHLENAKKGKAVGHRAFGWEDDKVTLRQSEAKPMLEVVDKLMEGLPTLRAAHELNNAGVLTATGNRWTASSLKQYLTNPRVAGYRTYRREVIRDGNGEPVQGTWEPLLDPVKWELLVSKISRPDHRKVKSRPGKRTFMLTGMIRCAVCRGPMYGGKQQGGAYTYYMCRNDEQDHMVSCSGASVEDLVRRLVVAKIEADNLEPAQLPTPFSQDERIKELNTAIDSLMSQLGGPIKPERIYAQVERLEVELAELEDQRKAHALVNTQPPPTQLTLAEMESMDSHLQRGLVDRYLSAVYIKPPAGRTGSRFDPERVLPIWLER